MPLIPTVISADCRERRSLSEQVRELQDTRVVEAMARNNGNIAQAARELRVGRVFVYRVLRRLEGAVPREEA
ncbi:MAG TPA: helix-turn-helix domain-containing protein [Kofleriaceae bacterium]|nr:helix-turn-helix domain-containing protein [Kofleriaceae bacterium]